jgi:hypothetical protein
MSNEEEFTFDAGPADVITGHFQKDIKDVELAKMLARYLEVTTEIAALEAVKDDLRKELLERGRGVESIMAGDYAAFFQKVSGRVTTDWKQAYRDSVGEMPVDDVKKYVRKGEDSVRVDVKKLR